MKLTKLTIELQPSYADNAGKYIASIAYEDAKRNEVKLVLDPEVSHQLLGFIGPVITAAVGKAAREIEANIIMSLADQNQTLTIQ